MKRIVRTIISVAAILVCAGAVRAQDVRVNCAQNSTCTITPAGGLSWANGNLTFIFRPLNPRVSVYIFIRNQNPTSAHNSQTITVFQTPFSQDLAPNLSLNSSRWTQDVVTQNTTANASCNSVAAANDLSPGASGLGTCYVNTMFAAQVAIRITGANSQAGSPDNFDLAIVQETGQPGGQQPGASASQQAVQGSGANGAAPVGSPVLIAGQDNNPFTRILKLGGGGGLTFTTNSSPADGVLNSNVAAISSDAGQQSEDLLVAPVAFNGSTWDRMRGTANTGLADAPPLQVVSDGLAQAFTTQQNITTPGAATDILSVNANSGGKTLYFDHAVITNTVTGGVPVDVQYVTALGLTCTNLTIVNQKIGNATASTALGQSSCTTHPTATTHFNQNLTLPANSLQVIDLRGIIAPSGSTTGINFQTGTFTGNVSITLVWYEK